MTGISFCSQSHSFTIKDEVTIIHKHGRKDTMNFKKTKRKDVPVPTYPEPEGDPSY